MNGLRCSGARALVAVVVMSAGLGAASAPAAAAAEEPTVVVTPDTVFDGQVVRMDISGFPYGSSFLVQCAGSVLEPEVRETSVCTIREMLVVDGLPPSHADWTVTSTFTSYDGRQDIDCRTEPSGCVAGVVTLSDISDTTSIIAEAFVPITFAPPPSLTVEPSEGLLDGQEMTVLGEHLAPKEHALGYCTELWVCDWFDASTAGPDGTFEATVPARQRFTSEYETGSRVYCRATCSLVVGHPAEGPSHWVAYTMAEGDLSVTPATGLSDGQQVQVTGSELMPTYEGAPVGPFPTGGWALTQCDRAVLDQPNLLGAFTHCSVAPPTQAVTIDGSTLDTAVDVQATITKMLGGTTDCTAAPGACVVGLVRLEQDISLSTHLQPVTFD